MDLAALDTRLSYLCEALVGVEMIDEGTAESAVSASNGANSHNVTSRSDFRLSSVPLLFLALVLLYPRSR